MATLDDEHFLHPLAYLIGIEGIALLRGFAGEFDRAFTMERLAEVRRLLDLVDLGDGWTVQPTTTRQGYRDWAAFYDSPGNKMIEIEQPVVQGILDSLPVGTALDAACGTGRHTQHLVAAGHLVTGVDSSPEMLRVARMKLPGVDFMHGELDALPVPDATFDVVVCALALTHVADLEPVFSEFARVLKPGGHLVISDAKGLVENIEYPMLTNTDGLWGYLPVYTRSASEYVRAAYRRDFQLIHLEEPRRPIPLVRPDGGSPDDTEPPPSHDPAEPPSIWALYPFIPEATNAAFRGTATIYVWHFQLASTGRRTDLVGQTGDSVARALLAGEASPAPPSSHPGPPFRATDL